MTISETVINNFQSHENTRLEFSERMNVLFGESDHGKSSIIRGIKWNVLNRPNGDRFRRHDTDETSVIITKSDAPSVTRLRSDKINQYLIKGKKDPYKALRAEVPEDVSTVLNLDETNIQSQDEVYFLIDQSSGFISKKLNKVSGLEITDKVIKQANSEYKEVKKDRDSTNVKLVDVKQKILDIDWVDKANKFLSKLEKLQAVIASSESKFEMISDILSELKVLKDKKKKFISEDCIKFMDKLFGLKNKIEVKKERYEEITELLSDLAEQKKALSAITVIDVSELENMSESIESEQDRYDDIENIILSLQIEKKKLIDVSAEVIKADKAYQDELKRLGNCPTCGVKT